MMITTGRDKDIKILMYDSLLQKWLIFMLATFANGFMHQSLTAQSYEQTQNIEVFKGGKKMIAPWAGGMNSPQFCAVDMNNDQILDLFVYDKVSNAKYCFLNDGFPGQESYTYAPEYAYNFPEGNAWVVIEDLTCDDVADFGTFNGIGSLEVHKGYYENDQLKFELIQKRINYKSSVGIIPLYGSSIDRPTFIDVNNDGDMDIIGFSSLATRLFYYENMRIENGLKCDTVFYELKDRCWGNVLETGLDVELTLQDTCSNKFLRMSTNADHRAHSGSAIDIIDFDNNGTLEMALGDITFTNLNLLSSNGLAENTNFYQQEVNFPSNDIPVELETFPAPFFLDLNNDALVDLLVAPFATAGTDNYNNVWYYKNTGNANSANFEFQKMNFLVDEMIDVGEGAAPTLYDYNADGKLDLVIGNVGYYDGLGVYRKTLTLFENTGSIERPVFTYVTDDFLGLTADDLSSLVPKFGDIDGDGDQDLLIGDARGRVVLKRNNGSDAFPNFGPVELLRDTDDIAIDVGQNAAPELVDIDRDGNIDLLIGERGGNLNYYKGNGSLQFELITDSLGAVTTRKGNSNVGFSNPAVADFNGDGKYDLMLTGYNGEVYVYPNIEDNLEDDFELASNFFTGESIGDQTTVAVGDLSNDGKPEIIFGINNGGLQFYSNDPLIVGIKNNFIQKVNMDVDLYPNPTRNKLHVRLPNYAPGEIYAINVFDVMGRNVLNSKISEQVSKWNLGNLLKGVYLIEIYNADLRYLGKVLVQ